MPGNRIGGLKASATNKARYGKDWYARIGRIGGKNGHTGGFASMTHERVAECGRKGGAISKRGPAKHPHLRDDDVTIRKAEERKRLRAEIRALEAEEDWND